MAQTAQLLKMGKVADSAGFTFTAWSEDPMSEGEMNAICSLVAYAAEAQHSKQERVCENLADHFGVSNIQLLNRKSYDEVMAFLMELALLNEIKNEVIQ